MPIKKARATRRTAADVKLRHPRIMTTLVSSALFRQSQNNPAKTQLAIKTLELARQQKIDLLVLPAGFLTVTTRAEILPTIRPIIRLARKYDISIVVGVDLEEIKRFRSSDSVRMIELVTLGQMPTFLCIFDAATGKTEVFRQRSATSRHGRLRLVPDEVMTPKTLVLRGISTQVVVCGEMFDPRLFQETAPPTAIIITHTFIPRFSKSLKAKGRMGFSLVHSDHRIGHGGTLFCNDQGTDRSQGATLHVEGERGLWLEAALWQLSDKGRIRPAQPE